MASKAYVASMTVAELTTELKKRSLSCRGKKKALQNRLEEALEDEELSESSSDDGREATIRAASAVSSQLEGDGKGIRRTRGNVSDQEKQEELVVSIEHSKRGLTNDGTSNGDNIGTTVFNKNGDTDNIEQNSVQNIVIQPPITICEERPPETITVTPVNIVHQEPIVTQSEDAVMKQEPTNPLQSEPQSQEEQKNDNNSPPSSHDEVICNDTTSNDQKLSNTEQPALQLQLISSPIIKLPENEAYDQPSPLARVVRLLHSANSPSGRGGLLSPTVKSPNDFDIESEANSIAVEPPSPNRDDVSFVVDEENVSITESVEFGEATPYDKDTSCANVKDEGVFPVVEEKSQVHVVDIPNENDEEAVMVSEPIVDDSTAESQERDGKVSDQDIQVGVSSQRGLVDTRPIEVDVLVPIVEEDDMSVFSVEAAEVQKYDSDVKVSERPSTLLKSPDKSRSLSDSGNIMASDTTAVALDNSTDTENCKKRTVSVPEETTQRERSGTPTTKRRKISTSPKRVQERRRKWGSSVSRTPTSAHTAISSDILESIIPDDVKEEVTSEKIGNLSALEVVMNYGNDDEVNEQNKEQQEQPLLENEERKNEVKPVEEEEDILDLGKESSMVDEYEQEWKEKEKEREDQRKESQKAKLEIETRRRIEARVKARQQDDKEGKVEVPVVRRTPSPARRPPSRILHIVNLTRPFTNVQLKDLLQNGETVLVEGGYWTDRIKSHCIAVYTSMDSAIAARNRIHNLKWPRQNPRLLKADYLTTDEVREYSNGELEIQPPSPSSMETENVIEINDRLPMETVAPSDNNQQTAKENIHIEANRKQRLSSTDTKGMEVETEDKPKSVLDNLFRKTKATPPIYWLPLSETEASEKEAERKSIEVEREKRREERRKERELEDQIREKKFKEEQEQRAKEKMRRRDRSRSRSPYARRRSPSPRRRSPAKRGYSPRRSRSPVRRRRSGSR